MIEIKKWTDLNEEERAMVVPAGEDQEYAIVRLPTREFAYSMEEWLEASRLSAEDEKTLEDLGI